MSAVEKNRGLTEEVTVNLFLNVKKEVYKDLLFACLIYDSIDKSRIEVLRTDAVRGNLQESASYVLFSVHYLNRQFGKCSIFVQMPISS